MGEGESALHGHSDSHTQKINNINGQRKEDHSKATSGYNNLHLTAKILQQQLTTKNTNPIEPTAHGQVYAAKTMRDDANSLNQTSVMEGLQDVPTVDNDEDVSALHLGGTHPFKEAMNGFDEAGKLEAVNGISEAGIVEAVNRLDEAGIDEAVKGFVEAGRGEAVNGFDEAGIVADDEHPFNGEKTVMSIPSKKSAPLAYSNTHDQLNKNGDISDADELIEVESDDGVTAKFINDDDMESPNDHIRIAQASEQMDSTNIPVSI
ncbi:hypothetical protein L2E82_35420 [Cichorium intybus]|uniref:Uncharacterized protein n=1 Tax=Cichorium intybus TaxID=13427 RepID=A0ACB9BNS7_CICIN|nr:hypothetical protein L2E82_35420 [Cichorium intybus]